MYLGIFSCRDPLKEQILSTQVFMASTQCIWNSLKMNSTHVHGDEGTCQPRGLGGFKSESLRVGM